MKYEVPLHRTERRDAQVFAGSRDEALQLARAANLGFSADTVVELGEDDEPGENHLLYGECESCSAFIWEGERCVTNDDDGASFCEKCAKALNQPRE